MMLLLDGRLINIFGFFEAIYGFLTRSLGNRGDTPSATGSLHSKARSIYNLVDTTEWEVGVRGDSARRSGSLHAKVSYLMPRNKTPMIESSYDSSISSGNILSISGTGIITGISLKSGSANANIEITVDGSTLYDGDDLGGASLDGMSISPQIPFTSDFNISVSGNSGEFGAVVSYLLD